MPDSFYFKVFSGLLSEKHRNNIGPAIWEFLWCINRTTKEKVDEDGAVWGIVLGGKPISYMDVAKELGGSKSTTKRNFERLEQFGYIVMKRTAYGHIIYVRNSKKFLESAEYDTGAKNSTCADNGTGVPDMKHGYQKWHSGAKNGHSKKDNTSDITQDIKNNTATTTHVSTGESDGVPTTDPLRGDLQPHAVDAEISHTPDDDVLRLLNRFVELRGYGFDYSSKDEAAAKEILDAGVPINLAIQLLEERFNTYKPKHPRDRIYSLDYCVGYIFDQFFTEKEDRSTKKKNKRVAPMPKWARGEMKVEQSKKDPAELEKLLNSL